MKLLHWFNKNTVPDNTQRATSLLTSAVIQSLAAADFEAKGLEALSGSAASQVRAPPPFLSLFSSLGELTKQTPHKEASQRAPLSPISSLLEHLSDDALVQSCASVHPSTGYDPQLAFHL